MSSLLPVHYTKKEKDVESVFFDRVVRLKDEIGTGSFLNPSICDEKWLPLLSDFYGGLISYESDKSLREQIVAIPKIRRKLGTVNTVKKALQSLGVTVEVLEWFKTESEPYSFKIQIFLTDDLTQVLKRDDFNKYEKLIERTKNVRSRFESFIVDIPTIRAVVKVSTESEALKVRPFMNINELIINNDISLNGGWSYKATAKTAINENIATSDTNIKGGYRWQVEV
jgi:phage tail P2-like protein